MTDEDQIRVTLVNEQGHPVDHGRVVEIAMKTAMAEGAKGDIAISLVDANKMAELNSKYLNGEGPTDVISFPVDGLVTQEPEDGPPVMVGQIFLSPEVASTQAEGDVASEIDLLVAHGVLHLLGFDHETEEQAAEMRRRELAASGREGAQSQ